MYAIIETGGKQYQVKEGDVIDIELLESQNKEISFSKVLLLSDGNSIHVGAPHLENCLVQGELLEEVKGPKVFAYKYKRRKNYHRKVGHRQKYSRIKITAIKSK